jgi:copper chaperone
MIEFNINDMTCGHCASVITKAIKSVEQEARVEIDLAAKRVRICGRAEADDFADAIREAGYTPVVEKAEADLTTDKGGSLPPINWYC